MGSGDAEFPSGWKTSYPCKIFIVAADVLRPDILPQLKHVGFSLLLRFRLHPSLSWQFCGNLLQSSGVFQVLKVAPLWVSVLHLHAIEICPLPVPLLRLRNGDIPNLMLKSLWINHCMGIFMHDFLMIFHRRSFMPEFQCHCEIYRFRIHPTTQVLGFLLKWS